MELVAAEGFPLRAPKRTEVGKPQARYVLPRRLLAIALACLSGISMATTPPDVLPPEPFRLPAELAWQPAKAPAFPAGEIRVDGRKMDNLIQAAAVISDGSIVEIGGGTYRTPLHITRNHVAIIGRGHVIFEGATTRGKGTFVVSGDNTQIENIECRHVAVPHRNGACVRLQGSDLELRHVFFHSSEQGLLTGGKPGTVRILDSVFANLGREGQAHAIYQGGGKLEIIDSAILSSKDEGHEVKSRARRTTIRESVIASMNGRDSRLIDVSNGGVLTVIDSTLVQGPETSNWDMVGFAMEGGHHKLNRVTMRRNLIILERPGINRMLHIGNSSTVVDVSDNLIVTRQPLAYGDNNEVFRSREQAGLPPFPSIPAAGRP